MLAVKQHIIPHSVGMRKDRSVYFMLLVSLYTVIQVVEHGKCIRVNSIVHTAVLIVQPLETRIS